MNRRDLLKHAAPALTLPRGGMLRGQTAPGSRLNVALIGVWGRGTAHYATMRNENVVAICDVNEPRMKEALEVFPKAKTYWDWRRLLDQKDVEAVIICTADHHHAFIANWALNRDLHVFCEKPLGISVEEVRTVRANYLKRKAKVATQHGTQRHAYPNFARIRELILDGAIGELQTVHSWDSRKLPRPGYPQGEGLPPAGLRYEQWIGPSPYHPYTPQYFGGSSGLNCLFWNMYRDFGVGQMGDMGAHTMDLVWNAVDAGAPAEIDIDWEVSDKYDPNICPVRLKAIFEHPANSWRGPVKLVWYQGGLKPEAPKNYIDVSRIGNGAIFEGSKGSILADFTSRAVIPNNDDGDFTYYKRRGKEELLPLVMGTGQPAQAPPPPRAGSGRTAQAMPGGMRALPSAEVGPSGFPHVEMMEGNIPPAIGMPNTAAAAMAAAEKTGQPPPVRPDVFQQDWIEACKGRRNNVAHGTSSKTNCDFDYAGSMMEQMLLGLVAHRAGRKLVYDPVAGRVTNMAEANEWLKRTYRPGWTLDG
ncbi:MAG: Gfo/Idh/MocA family oxidoreductase [Bryobacterales bacterium]|nr:Gfo/Idh/MocA family oxidoreductase [Bryobacterales bacterium]